MISGDQPAVPASSGVGSHPWSSLKLFRGGNQGRCLDHSAYGCHASGQPGGMVRHPARGHADGAKQEAAGVRSAQSQARCHHGLEAARHLGRPDAGNATDPRTSHSAGDGRALVRLPLHPACTADKDCHHHRRSGGRLFRLGKRYAAILKTSGITLDVRSSAGSIENVKRITDADSGVQVALLQGGITDSKATPGLMSLGRLFLEPVWVFYRGGGEAIDRLAQLQGKRVGIGAEGSGTRALAEALFKPSGLLGGASVLSPLSGQAGVDAMAAGEIDAIVLVMAPEAPLVQSLLRDSRFNLMSLAQAEAYTRIFPYLQRIVLPRGVVDLVADLPKSDIAMLAAVRRTGGAR